jgi:hypothetical protein
MNGKKNYVFVPLASPLTETDARTISADATDATRPFRRPKCRRLEDASGYKKLI